MAVTLSALRPMTLDAFLAWADDGTDQRYELIDGEPVMMAVGSRQHRFLTANLTEALAAECRKLGGLRALSEAGVVRPGQSGRYFIADIVVTAETPPGPPYFEHPVLIVEVLSPSTVTVDRHTKLPEYQQFTSVQEIVLVDQDRPRVEVERRGPDGRWHTVVSQGLDAVLTLQSVPLALPLRSLYAGVLAGDAAP